MKKLIQAAILMACVAVLVGCATGPGVQYSHTADIANYHRFYWQPVKDKTPIKNPVLDSPLLDHRVRAAAIDALTTQGYKQVTTREHADFIVTYHTAAEKRLRSRSGWGWGVGLRYPFYAGPYWNPFFGMAYHPPMAYQVESYRIGYLIIDITNQRTGQLVWRGWSTATITPAHYSPRAVTKAVNRILQAFPPS